MSGAYFAPLVTKPTVIVEPGQYVTRGGELVEVHTVSAKHDFGCKGVYSDGINELWHRSGRLYSGMESRNDIVRLA